MNPTPEQLAALDEYAAAVKRYDELLAEKRRRQQALEDLGEPLFIADSDVAAALTKLRDAIRGIKRTP